MNKINKNINFCFLNFSDYLEPNVINAVDRLVKMIM